jgi:SOS-response transcriptional repressor LexA
LDAAYKSGELKRLIEAITPQGGGGHGDGREPVTSVLPREVPVINSVAAGYPTEFTDLGYPARFADEYVRSPDVDDPDAFAARVVGDSMLPEYREGDIVIFSPVRPVKSGMDCFVRLERDHESTFKRIFFQERRSPGALAVEEGEWIRLQPLNPAFAVRVVHREEVAGMYAAVSVTRVLGGG